jgi:hypothetical protein
MKPFQTKFTDKTSFGQICACNYDIIWIYVEYNKFKEYYHYTQTNISTSVFYGGIVSWDRFYDF